MAQGARFDTSDCTSILRSSHHVYASSPISAEPMNEVDMAGRRRLYFLTLLSMDERNF